MAKAYIDYKINGTMTRDVLNGEHITATIHPEGHGHVIVDDGVTTILYASLYRVRIERDEP